MVGRGSGVEPLTTIVTTRNEGRGGGSMGSRCNATGLVVESLVQWEGSAVRLGGSRRFGAHGAVGHGDSGGKWHVQ